MAAKLLLIEADRTLGSFYQERLQAEGFEVRWVADSRAAVALAAEYRPELAVLDLLLPGTAGAKVLETLHHTPGLEATPIILLTAVPPPAAQPGEVGSGSSASNRIAQSRMVAADLVERIHHQLNVKPAS